MTIPTDCLYYLITRSALTATGVLRGGFAKTGAANIRPSYIGVLMCLWKEDGLRSAVLGRQAGLEPSSMTGVLDRMERDGLIRREADPDDRRAQQIFLTDEGRSAEEPVLLVVEKVLAKITEGITERELETTKKTLRKLLDLAQKQRH